MTNNLQILSSIQNSSHKKHKKQSPVAYIGKMKHYDNPNVFFQLNPRDIQGRIQNLGDTFAQKIVKASHSKQPSPSRTARAERTSLVLDSSMMSQQMETARAAGPAYKGAIDEIKNKDLDFIDFNCLEVVGHQKKKNRAQQIRPNYQR